MKNKITPCLWFADGTEEAAKFYISIFEGSKIIQISKTPGTNEVLMASFKLFGQDFLALNGRQGLDINPSVSFFVNCSSKEEVDSLWEKLSDGGKTLMPLDKYPFSKRYGWIEDKYGVSWQIMLNDSDQNELPKIVPCLMFNGTMTGRAKEAISHYLDVFNDSKIGKLELYGRPDNQPDKEGTVMYGDFKLSGQWFAAMDSAHAHGFQFNDGISFQVVCKNQEEVDYYWNKLTSNGGEESMCGWLKDRFGLSWQITPEILPKLIQDPDPAKAKKAMEAMMKMRKIIIADLMDAQS